MLLGPGLGVASTQGGFSALLQLRYAVAASAPGRPILLLVLLTVGGVLVASSIPILFTPEPAPISRNEKNWPKAGFSVQYVSIGTFMTLGRFLIFFVIGLVLALTMPQLTWLLWPLAGSALFVVVQLIRS